MRIVRPTSAPAALLGLSLIEMLVAVAISSIIFAAVASFSLFTARRFVSTGNYADLDRASRNALDVLTRDIRMAKSMTAFTTNKLTMTAYDNSTLIFEYTPANGRLTRKAGAETTVLLEQCDYLNFQVYQRRPMPGFQFFPATNAAGAYDPAVAKLVDVSWRCSRKILGQKMNTESVQTAKIVMRN
jgi:prepilin-type N-terminal cleavage/methylation domain-containing protein